MRIFGWLLCRLRIHDPVLTRMRNNNERWWVYLHYCRRCLTPIDASAKKD